MGALTPFRDKNDKEIVIFLRDVKTFQITAKDGDGNPLQIDAYGAPKFGIKSNITDTSFLTNGTGTIVDDGSVPLRGRFDVVIDFGAAGVVAAFAASDINISAFLEITLVDTSGNDQTPTQYPIVINRDINV